MSVVSKTGKLSAEPIQQSPKHGKSSAASSRGSTRASGRGTALAAPVPQLQPATSLTTSSTSITHTHPPSHSPQMHTPKLSVVSGGGSIKVDPNLLAEMFGGSRANGGNEKNEMNGDEHEEEPSEPSFDDKVNESASPGMAEDPAAVEQEDDLQPPVETPRSSIESLAEPVEEGNVFILATDESEQLSSEQQLQQQQDDEQLRQQQLHAAYLAEFDIEYKQAEEAHRLAMQNAASAQQHHQLLLQQEQQRQVQQQQQQAQQQQSKPLDPYAAYTAQLKGQSQPPQHQQQQQQHLSPSHHLHLQHPPQHQYNPYLHSSLSQPPSAHLYPPKSAASVSSASGYSHYESSYPPSTADSYATQVYAHQQQHSQQQQQQQQMYSQQQQYGHPPHSSGADSLSSYYYQQQQQHQQHHPQSYDEKYDASPSYQAQYQQYQQQQQQQQQSQQDRSDIRSAPQQYNSNNHLSPHPQSQSRLSQPPSSSDEKPRRRVSASLKASASGIINNTSSASLSSSSPSQPREIRGAIFSADSRSSAQQQYDASAARAGSTSTSSILSSSSQQRGPHSPQRIRAPNQTAKPVPLKQGTGLAAGQAAVGKLSEKNDTLKSSSSSAEYKPHTLAEFRDLTLALNLGGLGPDLDNEERKAKEAKNQRVRALAQRIREENAIRLALLAAQPKKQKEEPVKELSAFEKAKMFAKESVPKPRVLPKEDEEEVQYVQQRIGGSSASTLVPVTRKRNGKSPERIRSVTTGTGTVQSNNGNTNILLKKSSPSSNTSFTPSTSSQQADDVVEQKLQELLQKQAAQRMNVQQMKSKMGIA